MRGKNCLSSNSTVVKVIIFSVNLFLYYFSKSNYKKPFPCHHYIALHYIALHWPHVFSIWYYLTKQNRTEQKRKEEKSNQMSWRCLVKTFQIKSISRTINIPLNSNYSFSFELKNFEIRFFFVCNFLSWRIGWAFRKRSWKRFIQSIWLHQCCYWILCCTDDENVV